MFKLYERLIFENESNKIKKLILSRIKNKDLSIDENKNLSIDEIKDIALDTIPYTNILEDDDIDYEINSLRDTYSNVPISDIKSCIEINEIEFDYNDENFTFKYMKIDNKKLIKLEKYYIKQYDMKQKVFKGIENKVKSILKNYDDDDYSIYGSFNTHDSIYITLNKNDITIRISNHVNLSDKHKSPDYSLVLSNEDVFDVALQKGSMKSNDIYNNTIKFDNENSLVNEFKNIIIENI